MSVAAGATVLAGGGVLYRRPTSGPPEYAVVHRPRYDDWSLAKGKVDSGESAEAAALREVEEETGWSCRPGALVGSVAYTTPPAQHKVVRYWLMEAHSGSFTANDEVDAMAWLPFDAAAARLTYPRDRSVLDWGHALVESPERGTIYLVRHASAGRRGEWPGGERERPVQAEGWGEVEALTAMLTELPVARVISSPYTRCLQTVVGLAAALEIELEEEPRLAEGTAPEDAARLVTELAGTAVVLCSHGDVVSNLVGAAAAEGAALTGGLRWEKGSVWVLGTAGGRITGGRYLPAPA